MKKEIQKHLKVLREGNHPPWKNKKVIPLFSPVAEQNKTKTEKKELLKTAGNQILLDTNLECTALQKLFNPPFGKNTAEPRCNATFT